MPIYEYKRADGTTFEVIQKYTAPAIHFKGSGFHNTDYSSSRRAKSGQAPKDDTSSSSSSKSESKTPEKKSESKGTSKSDSSKSKDKGK